MEIQPRYDQVMAALRRAWLLWLAVGFIGFAAGMAALSTMMMSRWTKLYETTSADAERRMSEARGALGEGPPYLEVGAAGEMVVRRELERAEPTDLRKLHLLGWDPAREQLVEIEFPWWFVRLKMSEHLNLGTLASALAGDWRHLDLKVTEDDLERLGPGLVLDHRRADGGRLLLWTE